MVQWTLSTLADETKLGGVAETLWCISVIHKRPWQAWQVGWQKLHDVQISSESFQGPDNLSEQSVPVLHHLQQEKCISLCSDIASCSSLSPLPLVQSLGTTKNNLTPSPLLCHFRCFLIDTHWPLKGSFCKDRFKKSADGKHKISEAENSQGFQNTARE